MCLATGRRQPISALQCPWYKVVMCLHDCIALCTERACEHACFG